MAWKGTVIPASTKPIEKTDVTGWMLNSGMKPFKYRWIYIFIEYWTYVSLHMVLQTKLKTIQDISASDTHNIYDYILLCQNNNIFPAGIKNCIIC